MVRSQAGVSVRTKQLETTLMRSVLAFALERGMIKEAPSLKARCPTGALVRGTKTASSVRMTPPRRKAVAALEE